MGRALLSLQMITFALSALAAITAVGKAEAASAWDDIRSNVYAGRQIESGAGVVKLTAPLRPEDQRRVPVHVTANVADGQTVKSVSLIIDENPSPVAAVFRFDANRTHVDIALNVRLNQQTHVRAILETADGRLYMTEQLVKFAGGQSACSAPPTGDPADIIANMGKMTVVAENSRQGVSSAYRRMKLDVSHPNHTGMQLDQQTLLYIPLRMVTDLKIEQAGKIILTMDGSISLSENPDITFDIPSKSSDPIAITLRDSEQSSWTKTFAVGPES